MSHYPAELGKGLLSTRGDVGALLVPLETLTPLTPIDHPGVPEVVVNIVDSRFEYQREMSASASLGYAGVGSVSASMSSSFKKSARRVTLVLRKVVRKFRWSIPDAHWRPEALAEFGEAGADAVIRKYGDAFVEQVITGGSLAIAYQLDFDSEESASSFSIEGEGKSGPYSGAVSFHQKVISKAATTSIKMEAVVIGAIHAPPIFEGGRATAVIDVIDDQDPRVSNLLEYFDNFQSDVTGDVAVECVPQEISQAANAPSGAFDLSEVRDSLEDAAELLAEVDDRIADVEYMQAVGFKLNPDVPRDAPEKLLDLLTAQRDLIQEYVRQLTRVLPSGLATMETFALTRETLAKVPPTWKTNVFVKFDRKIVETDGRHGPRTKLIRLPRLREGQPLRVALQLLGSGTGRTVGGHVEVLLIRRDNAPTLIFNSSIPNRHGQFKQFDRTIVSAPSDAVSVQVRSRTAGFTGTATLTVDL